MQQIRNGVFETNSSSTHSVSINYRGNKRGHLTPWKDGYVHTSLGEFGWEIRDYHDAGTKLSYLLTMAWEINGFGHIYYCDDDEQIRHAIEAFIETNDFKRIDRAVSYETGSKGIWIETGVSGYIDHQSFEDYGTLDDFLNDWSTDIEDFIFNENVVLHTDNDNH